MTSLSWTLTARISARRPQEQADSTDRTSDADEQQSMPAQQVGDTKARSDIARAAPRVAGTSIICPPVPLLRRPPLQLSSLSPAIDSACAFAAAAAATIATSAACGLACWSVPLEPTRSAIRLPAQLSASSPRLSHRCGWSGSIMVYGTSAGATAGEATAAIGPCAPSKWPNPNSVPAQGPAGCARVSRASIGQLTAADVPMVLVAAVRAMQARPASPPPRTARASAGRRKVKLESDQRVGTNAPDGHSRGQLRAVRPVFGGE
jgi:hypothetical protein